MVYKRMHFHSSNLDAHSSAKAFLILKSYHWCEYDKRQLKKYCLPKYPVPSSQLGDIASNFQLTLACALHAKILVVILMLLQYAMFSDAHVYHMHHLSVKCLTSWFYFLTDSGNGVGQHEA